jgi:GntR family transcriptional regulator
VKPATTSPVQPRGSGPVFRHLARVLAEAIEAGSPAVGDVLPTEMELARRHGISRNTVRQALAELRMRGLIESKQGIGSVVLRRAAQTTYSETYSSIDELIRYAKGSPLRVLTQEDVVADADLARLLRGREGQAYLRLTGTRFRADDPGRPVGFTDVYVDGIYGGVRHTVSDLSSSIAEALERLYGVTIQRIEQEINATLVTGDIADILEADVGAPMLVIQRWYHGENGRVFEYARSCYPTDRFVYRNVLAR